MNVAFSMFDLYFEIELSFIGILSLPLMVNTSTLIGFLTLPFRFIDIISETGVIIMEIIKKLSGTTVKYYRKNVREWSVIISQKSIILSSLEIYICLND